MIHNSNSGFYTIFLEQNEFIKLFCGFGTRVWDMKFTLVGNIIIKYLKVHKYTIVVLILEGKIFGSYYKKMQNVFSDFIVFLSW